MRERTEQVLRIVCLVLAALLAFQVARIALHSRPLAHVTIPPLPTLSADTNAPPDAHETNAQLAHAAGRNGTNAAPRHELATVETNQLSHHPPARPATNSAAAVESAGGGTNTAAKQMTPGTAGANAVAIVSTAKTNSPPPEPTIATNFGPRSHPELARAGARSFPPGMQGPNRKAPELSPENKARVLRIYDSELFGPVMHPLPMALLGIAGDTAFLRAPDGQTGLVKAGHELGSIKLLQIGVNRVLIEQDGEKKELTIFNGYGGESLLPKK